MLRAFGTPEHAAGLGADVPVCLGTRAQRMRGTGEETAPVADLPPVWAVLVNPRVHVATPRVFEALTQKSNPPMPDTLPRFDTDRALMRWLAEMRNDLEGPAISLAPQIAQVLRAISGTDGVYLSRMSGSGGTCFGLYDNQGLAELAARNLQQAHPGWWIYDCRLS